MDNKDWIMGIFSGIVCFMALAFFIHSCSKTDEKFIKRMIEDKKQELNCVDNGNTYYMGECIMRGKND